MDEFLDDMDDEQVDDLLMPEEDETSSSQMYEHFRFVADKGQSLLRVDNLQFPAWAIHHDRNHIQRFHPVITFHRLIVHQDATRLSRQLDAVTGSAHHTVYQELIHPEQGLPRRYPFEYSI